MPQEYYRKAATPCTPPIVEAQHATFPHFGYAQNAIRRTHDILRKGIRKGVVPFTNYEASHGRKRKTAAGMTHCAFPVAASL